MFACKVEIRHAGLPPRSALDIEGSKIRKVVNGDVLIEIPGTDGAKKADEFANKLRKVLKKEVSISRPVAKGELRIVSLDDSIILKE